MYETIVNHQRKSSRTSDFNLSNLFFILVGCKMGKNVRINSFRINDPYLLTLEDGVVIGADAVKIEGILGNEKEIHHIIQSGIPVMGHLGLMPQFYNAVGGWKVQGRNDAQAKKIKQDALAFQAVGAFSLVLECVPEYLADEITQMLSIPVIGIGAGRKVDGQVLVLYDLLGLSKQKTTFSRSFIDGSSLVSDAIEAFCSDVNSNQFPSEKEIFIQ